MNDQEKFQVALNAIAEQRNAALNDVINLRIQLAEAQEELTMLKTPKESNG